jgi:hypothetical protein
VGGTVEVRTDSLKAAAAARWYDPREGKWTEAGAVVSPVCKFTAPSAEDWVLWIGAKR